MTDTQLRRREVVLGFDHLVIGARHLEPARRALEHAGFRRSGGGVHVGRGTANELVRLQSGYLEVLTVEDRELALAFGGSRRQAAEILDAAETELLGFAVEVSDISACHGLLADAGVPVSGPHAMARQQPDGRKVSWRTLLIEDRQWHSACPFLIQWDGEGHDWADASAVQPNRVERVMGVVVSAADIEHVAGIYRTLGASEVRGSGNGIRLRLADITVEIRQSDSEGGAPDRLQSVTLGGGPTPAYREALLAGPFAGWLIGNQEL